MKLISFAAISLLAITVSAWPPNSPSAQDIQESQDSTVRDILQILDSPEQDVQQPSQDDTSHGIQESQDYTGRDIQQSHEDSIVQGIQQILKSPAQDIQQSHEDSIVQGIQQILKSPAQDIQQSHEDSIVQDIQQYQGAIAPDIPQQSQDGATQSSQQSDRDKVQTEIDRLKLALDVQEHQFSQIDNYINSEKQKVTDIQAMIRKGAIKLQGISISMDERLRLQQNIYDLRMLADELTAKYRKQYYAYIDAMTECGTAKAELQMLRYNQRLIAEYNADHEDQVRISPNSFYNIEILKIQYIDILNQIDKLLVEQKAMWESTRVFGGNVFRGQSEELENAIRVLQIYSGVARRIVWQHKYSQSISEWSARYLNLYLWNGQI
ncbi:hypothetical protein BASA50_000454 [Batrachochytrium salamandrivorans]|uniref:Uncharacterized protein n=1 Tax=Batrachochytrium salamandrivorans TaxID=1357716 RepID=A0ABQ8ETT8_9FUNG|nr:hypothetical protein BASA50_000454 [Batrachochytrium salamandrivorans]